MIVRVLLKEWCTVHEGREGREGGGEGRREGKGERGLVYTPARGG